MLKMLLNFAFVRLFQVVKGLHALNESAALAKVDALRTDALAALAEAESRELAYSTIQARALAAMGPGSQPLRAAYRKLQNAMHMRKRTERNRRKRAEEATDSDGSSSSRSSEAGTAVQVGRDAMGAPRRLSKEYAQALAELRAAFDAPAVPGASDDGLASDTPPRQQHCVLVHAGSMSTSSSSTSSTPTCSNSARSSSTASSRVGGPEHGAVSRHSPLQDEAAELQAASRMLRPKQRQRQPAKGTDTNTQSAASGSSTGHAQLPAVLQGRRSAGADARLRQHLGLGELVACGSMQQGAESQLTGAGPSSSSPTSGGGDAGGPKRGRKAALQQSTRKRYVRAQKVQEGLSEHSLGGSSAGGSASSNAVSASGSGTQLELGGVRVSIPGGLKNAAHSLSVDTVGSSTASHSSIA